MNRYFFPDISQLLLAHILDVHLPNVLIGVAAGIEIPLITILGRRIGATQPQIANLVLLSSLCRTVLDIPAGVVVEYAGVRNVMLVSLLLNALGGMVGLYIRNLFTLRTYCVLSGISLGSFFLSQHIFVAGISSKRFRGTIMSVLSGLVRWSHVVGPTLSGFIANITGDIVNAFYTAIFTSLSAFASILFVSTLSSREDCTRSCIISPGVSSVNIIPEEDGGCLEECRGHSSLKAGEEHYFRPLMLWYTFTDYWHVIWRLGLYVVFFTVIRSNRKLMLVFAGMRASLSDAEISYLLSFSFIFDALLFPLGGLVMDFLGRRYAMVPAALFFSACFLMLPFCTTNLSLAAAAASFGFADALGCGLLLTLTADHAPNIHGAPFFGIMRTLGDLGHVVAAGGASYLLKRVEFHYTCYILAVTGLGTVLWGVYRVPKEENLPETPRLRQIAEKIRPERSVLSEPLIGSETMGSLHYGTKS